MEMGTYDDAVVSDNEDHSPSREISESRERGDSINIVSEPDTVDELPHEEVTSTPLKIEVPSETKPTLPLLVPSLKGKMTYEGGNVTCKGVWGMSDFAHTQPGQTSDFEFKLVKADEGSGLFPVDGKYQGWFMLKQMAPLKGSVKVEDKELKMKFIKEESEGLYTVQGNGINKFGSFTLRGSLQEDGSIHMYREYYNLTPTPVPGLKRRLSIDAGGDEGAKSNKKPTKSSEGAAILPPPAISPRESTGRVRKQSTAMKEYMDMNQPKPLPIPKAAPSSSIPVMKLEPPPVKTPKAAPVAAAPSSSSAYGGYGIPNPLVRHESTSDRAQRMPPFLKKCAELLKEMSKHPQAVWFLEPVDFVKLNIPEYPSIISNPMDFSTIRVRIETNVYAAVEAFAEDMRLVFRNAMTFNASKDNLVHIAARDLANKFEDRFRVMISQLHGVNAYSSGAILDLEPLKTPRQSLGGAKKPGTGKTPRLSLGKAPTAPAGPRVASAVNLAGMNYLPPAADGSAHQLAEMQRMMQTMQAEISNLRSQVRNSETTKKLQDAQDASHNPLTFDEKKNLIAQIHRLPPESLEHVLEIIQSVIPPREDSEDIEIPLDMLDTFTLRRLQKYVESRPRPAPVVAAPVQRQSSVGGAPKRARKSTSSTKLAANSSANTSTAALRTTQMTPLADFNGDNDLPLLDEDDLLFAPDSFEELKSNAAREQQFGEGSNVQHASQDHGMMDDEDDFSSLMSLHQSSAPINSDNINVGNADAWNQ